MRFSAEDSKWTHHEDYILMMLIGRASYAQIALRLGRAESAVQRRASNKGYSQRAERRSDKIARQSALSEIQTQYLLATEAELMEFLPVFD